MRIVATAFLQTKKREKIYSEPFLFEKNVAEPELLGAEMDAVKTKKVCKTKNYEKESMRIFSNPFFDKKESGKIYSEPFLFEKKIDQSGFAVDKVDFQKPKEKSIDWEAFFEYLAGSTAKCTRSHVFLTILAIIADISVYVISTVGPPQISLENGTTKPVLNWELLLLFPIFLGCMGFHIFPELFEYRRHFSHVNDDAIILIKFFGFIYAFSIFWSIPFSWFLIIIATLLLTYAINIFIGAINAQKCTKLRFDPCKYNHLYTLIHAESKDKEIIRIVESGVLKITVKNIGSEPWNSAGFVLHRHTGARKHSDCFCTRLPEFTLSPQAQIDLIPETADYDEECVRIPNVHCFGHRDRDVEVKTFISPGKKGMFAEREDKQILICPHTTEEEKVAEHVAKYQLADKGKWSNITPC